MKLIVFFALSAAVIASPSAAQSLPDPFSAVSDICIRADADPRLALAAADRQGWIDPSGKVSDQNIDPRIQDIEDIYFPDAGSRRTLGPKGPGELRLQVVREVFSRPSGYYIRDSCAVLWRGSSVRDIVDAVSKQFGETPNVDSNGVTGWAFIKELDKRVYLSSASDSAMLFYAKRGVVFSLAVTNYDADSILISYFATYHSDLMDSSSLSALTEDLIVRGRFSDALGIIMISGSNNADAQTFLGEMYTSGMGVDIDASIALIIFNRAADLGSARAKTDLGVLYRDGFGVKQDFSVAFMLFKEASDRGYVYGTIELSWLYFLGNGVPRDVSRSMALVEVLAEEGNSTAQYSLGYFYANGPDEIRNLNLARYWMTRSAEQRMERASAWLEENKEPPN